MALIEENADFLMQIGLIGVVEDRRLVKVIQKGWVRAAKCRPRMAGKGG